MSEMRNLIDHTDSIRIGILLYNNVSLQDFSGPAEVFSNARNLTNGKYCIFTIGLNSSIIQTENYLIKITPDYTIYDMPAADYLIIPGASMPTINKLMNNQILTDFISNWNKKKKAKIVTTGNGSYLLANTGALDNKKATTHIFVLDDFSRLFPKVNVIKDVQFVEDENYITTSGVTSGVDVALYILEQKSGGKIKDMASKTLQYCNHREKKWRVNHKSLNYYSRDY